MKFLAPLAAACAIAAVSGTAFAQNAARPAPQNVLQLAASGSVDVQQDLLVLTLAATREGADASTVQTQLRQALDAGLAEAKRAAQPEQMEVRTGQFGLYPRYGKDGKITAWQGRAELVLQGRDFSRITTTAGRIQSMPISQIAFDLSKEARARVQAEAQTRAIEEFKNRAGELAKGFGFSGYSLREVSVNSDEMSPGPRAPRMMAMQAKSSMMSADESVPVEAGKTQVVVHVSGSVQLR
ncbi:SIMPL domain-containing protein [Paracidovorax avenae]|uniref:SIMPL domain-containing protein n=1 Tax=Paracidovorax avenae TaxID=80867 RepID=UPI000D1639A4|nr:SIMPL domain-containing protein [Paracidovorax avenae]AVS61640.1 SIMPL domain-containing protein [Paracidovorax avenae]